MSGQFLKKTVSIHNMIDCDFQETIGKVIKENGDGTLKIKLYNMPPEGEDIILDDILDTKVTIIM